MAESEGNYSFDVHEGLSYRDLRAQFESGSDSPSEYLDRCLATIDAKEGEVQAWTALNRESACAQAELSSKRWRSGTQKSSIDGMPIGIKDLYETKDMPTEKGSRAFKNNFPKMDNPSVWALREAGAIILGKTVTTELGISEPGPTTNPFGKTRTPGGSSSGSGAAVGAGMVPAAIGSQVGGSLIRPSSYCANWGLKPSQGAINRGGSQSSSMSTHGVHANSVHDMWAVGIEIAKRAGGDPGACPLSGPDDTPPAENPSHLVLLETEGWSLVDAKTKELFSILIEQIEQSGVRVSRRDNSEDVERFEQAIVGLQDLANSITSWEQHWGLRDLIVAHPELFGPRTKEFCYQGPEKNPQRYVADLQRREAVRDLYRGFATEVDAFIQLSSPGPAPYIVVDEPGQPLEPWPTGNTIFNIPSSLLGAPAVNVPLMSVGGMPAGVQFLGQHGTDAKTTSIARWAHEALTPVAS